MNRRELLVGSLAGAATLWLPGCSGDPPAAPPPTPEPPPPPRVATTVWGADNVRDLVPVVPQRKTAIPSPVPPLPAYDAALGVLGGVVDRFAGDPENPWAIAHGVLARGPDFRLSDGREAIPYVFSTYGELHDVGGRSLVGFPKQLGEKRVEPHMDLLLKNLGEVGVPVDRVFSVSGTSVTMADLYRYTLLKTYLDAKTNHASFASPNDTPWTLQALAQWCPGDELQWVALDGTPMDLDDLASFVAAVITQESAWMFERMQKGQKFEKQGQNLFNYTCGGAHLLQGAALAVARGFGSPKARKAVEAQVPLWFYRLPIELSQYDTVLQRNPAELVRLLAQRLKFLGHFLESLSKMAAMGLYTASDDQATLLEGAAQNLALTVDALQKKGVFDGLAELRAKDEQLYLDLVGDSAHAIRGLELALGRQSVLW